jgi:hypothetical protein
VHPAFRQACVEAGRFELRVGLALPVDDGSDILQEGRQVVFGSFAAAGTTGIQTRDPALQFVDALANGLAIPAQFAFGSAGATWAQGFDRAHQKQRAALPLSCLAVSINTLLSASVKSMLSLHTVVIVSISHPLAHHSRNKNANLPGEQICTAEFILSLL